MSLIVFIQVFFVCLFGAMSPGPSMAVVINNAIFKNRYHGVLTSIGHGLGITIYAIFAVIGIGLIINTNILIFNGMKIISIMFLIYLGSKKFSTKLNKLLKKCEKITSKNTKLQVNLAINYGSKSELVGAFKKIKIKKNIINENSINKNLETKNIPDPDLLIRTGNTKRLSNFLLWQIAYTEIFFEKKLWPAFNEKDYNRIIYEYKRTKRNFGKI